MRRHGPDSHARFPALAHWRIGAWCYALMLALLSHLRHDARGNLLDDVPLP